MLERIHQVKGLGLLHDANGEKHCLKKASFIYSDNGRGKSTLASLFRSCATNNPALIISRKTIDGVNNQEARLQFSDGQNSIFKNGSWNHHRPELLVFDADFVEQNVYSGGQVSPDQRKNLLQFALGSSAVVAQREYNQADENVRQATATVRNLTNQLSVMHAGMTLAEFQKIVEVPDANNRITALNEQIIEAKNIDRIQAKVLPQQLTLPTINLDSFFSILNTSLNNIDLAAEKQVKEHLDTHNKPKLEKWVSDGHAYGEEENCLFCNQPLEDIDLIQAYRSYFNQDYNQLKTDVARLVGIIATICQDAVVDGLKTSFDIACVKINGWQEHIKPTMPTLQEDAARQAITELRTLLEGLKQRKEANLLESIGTEDDKREALAKWQIALNVAKGANESIGSVIQLINKYKNNLSTVNAAELQQHIVNLELAKRRYEPKVVDLFAQLTHEKKAETITKTTKQTKKDVLNQTMQEILGTYKDSINSLLKKFGAQFEIPAIDFNYLSGLRSDYLLQMRGKNIALSSGVPDFRTALSESDKRTLAFAFFIASIESDSGLANKIVVIDDPMCSFDLNRKTQTMTVLRHIHDNCQQLIVLAHDVHFLRGLRDGILKQKNINSNDIKCLKLKAIANSYSDFSDIDIDTECETAYLKAYRLLDTYLQGKAPNNIDMDVARSIRPMLEGYLHRRFPGKINRGLLFGQIIKLINDAQGTNPLVHAQAITGELTEINDYAGKFHHDTNPDDQIGGEELRCFVIRALDVVHWR